MNKAHEQAQITRQRNKEIRAAARAEREAQEKADKALVLEALRGVLRDPNASAEQRLYAVGVLDHMQHYYLVHYGLKHPGKDSDTLIADFAKRMEAYQEKDS